MGKIIKADLRPPVMFCTPCYLMGDKIEQAEYVMEGTTLCQGCMDRVKKRQDEQKGKEN